MIFLCVHGGCRCFAASRTTHDPADFFKLLRIAQGIPYFLKGVRFHELPTGSCGCRSNLSDDITEHIIADILVLAVNHGTQCTGRHAVQTRRSLFLAGILRCIYPESLTDSVFLLLCHCTVHFILNYNFPATFFSFRRMSPFSWSNVMLLISFVTLPAENCSGS